MAELPPHRLLGSGAPPIVVLNGAGARLGYWKNLTDGLAGLSTVLFYDRKVPPRSTELPLLGAHYVEELRALLMELGLAPPYLLVAHSMGGLYADLFARLYPDEVAGLVLVDASHPDQERRFAPRMNRFGRFFRGVIDGWDRLFGPGAFTEVVRFESIAAEIAAAPAFPDIPLTVITAGATPPAWLISAELWDVHLANQEELTALSPRGRQLIAEASDHHVPVRQPQLIVDAVRDMLAGMKKGPGVLPGP